MRVSIGGVIKREALGKSIKGEVLGMSALGVSEVDKWESAHGSEG